MVQMQNDELAIQWYRTLAVEHGIPVRFIMGDRPSVNLNVPTLHRSTHQHFAALEYLFHAGEIDLRLNSAGRRQCDPHEVALALRAKDVDNLTFSLTEKGGRQWEEQAQPDWSRYIRVEWDESTLCLTCVNQSTLMAYLGWMPLTYNIHIRWASSRWQTLSEYNIVYWKKLSKSLLKKALAPQFRFVFDRFAGIRDGFCGGTDPRCEPKSFVFCP